MPAFGGDNAVRTLRCVVDQRFDGETVDVVLRRQLRMSRRAVSRAKYRHNGIMLDGVNCKSNVVVRAGQTVSAIIEDAPDMAQTCTVRPVPGVVDIVYEDEDVVVANKPVGLSMYPGSSADSLTFGNYLMWHFQQSGESCTYHPVQRLDKGTSGLLVVAKNGHAQNRLQRNLHTPQFIRRYIAICHGVPAVGEGIVDVPIARREMPPYTFACPGGMRRALMIDLSRQTCTAASEGIEGAEDRRLCEAFSNIVQGELDWFREPKSALTFYRVQAVLPHDAEACPDRHFLQGREALQQGLRRELALWEPAEREDERQRVFPEGGVRTDSGEARSRKTMGGSCRFGESSNLSMNGESGSQGVPNASCGLGRQGELDVQSEPGGSELALVALQLQTGRTHQIRIHLACLGHPLVGDVAYGAPPHGSEYPVLHSAFLRFEHPTTHEVMEFVNVDL